MKRMILVIPLLFLLVGCGHQPPRYYYAASLPAINQLHQGDPLPVTWNASEISNPPQRESGTVTLSLLLVPAPTFSQKNCGHFANVLPIDTITADEQSGKSYQQQATVPASVPPGNYFLVGQAMAGTDVSCLARLVIVS